MATAAGNRTREDLTQTAHTATGRRRVFPICHMVGDASPASGIMGAGDPSACIRAGVEPNPQHAGCRVRGGTAVAAGAGTGILAWEVGRW